MSSNILIQRVCEYCGREFQARTTVTRYCGAICSRRAYKALKRGKKIQASNTAVAEIKSKSLVDVVNKQVLTVREAALLLGFPRQVINDMVRSKRLPAKNFGVRKTRIRREDLDALFAPPETIISPWEHQKDKGEIMPLKRSECYTIIEVLLKYNISPTILTRMIREHHVRKEQDGQNMLVPKTAIDRLFSGFQVKDSERKENEDLLPLDPEDCYTIAEAGKVLNLAPSGVYYGIMSRGIRKERIGKSVYVPKMDIDEWAAELLPRYRGEEKYSVAEVAELLGRSLTGVREILKKHGIEKIFEKQGKVSLLKEDIDPLIPLYLRK